MDWEMLMESIRKITLGMIANFSMITVYLCYLPNQLMHCIAEATYRELRIWIESNNLKLFSFVYRFWLQLFSSAKMAVYVQLQLQKQ